MKEKEIFKAIVTLSRYMMFMTIVVLILIIALLISLSTNTQKASNAGTIKSDILSNIVKNQVEQPSPGSHLLFNSNNEWTPPDTTSIPKGKSGQMIKYGKELIAHTANYFGPKGSIAQISNGMNCQNCHLDGGTRIFGNNFAGFIAGYPKMSGRSGKIEPATERIAECFQRSLSGNVPDTSGKEIQAIIAYMKWIGRGVKKGRQLYGSATEKLPFMKIAADSVKGKVIFMEKCKNCHGVNGKGLLYENKGSYFYPPLWGSHSYNDGAGMYRISNMAGFVKNNMPFGATYQNPQLTNDEAWNVAAFINSKPRPHKNQDNDWTDLIKKPIDFPFGPYSDHFSEKQHKFGPFNPILNTKNTNKNNF